MVASTVFCRKSLLCISSYSPKYVSNPNPSPQSTPAAPACVWPQQEGHGHLEPPSDVFTNNAQMFAQRQLNPLVCLLTICGHCSKDYFNISHPKNMHVGGGHLCSEFKILWASTENFSGRLPADLRSCPTFHTKECLVAKATTSSTPARLHIFPWLGFNPSSTSVNLSVVPAFLAAQRKKHTGFELFLLELL